MVRMEDTIRLVRERELPIKVLVGGWNAWKSSGGKVEPTPPQ